MKIRGWTTALATGMVGFACASAEDAPGTLESERAEIGEFYGVIDGTTGRLRLLSADQVGEDERGLFGELAVEQNGRRGVGRPNTVEVSTVEGTAGFGAPMCGPSEVCGDVQIGSRYGSAISNLTAHIVRASPANSVVPTQGNYPTTFQGLNNTLGLFVYEETVPASSGRSANFTSPKKWGFTRLSAVDIHVFGKVYGDVSTGTLCGDGMLSEGEVCDYSVDIQSCGENQFCNRECGCQDSGPTCGNQIIEEGEQCDDGNTSAGDGCDSSCQVEIFTGPSCAAILGAHPSARNGVYPIDPDGTGPLPSMNSFCDMAEGGWTLVMNQDPGELLPDQTTTVNPGNFGRLDATYRLGSSEIATIRPSAWKLTDGANSVFFRPDCIVDWTVDYFQVPNPHVCTTGYTDTTFTTEMNGGWRFVSTRGIGINFFGGFCSIRAYESNANNPPMGSARSCGFGTNEPVRLWYR